MWGRFFHEVEFRANLRVAACVLLGGFLVIFSAARVTPGALAMQNEGTQTAEAAATQTATAKSTETQTAEAAATQTAQALQALPAETQTAVAILTGTPTATGTPPTDTPTVTGTPPTDTPTVTGTPPTVTATFTGTPSPTPTQTNSPSPQDTETPTFTPIPTATFPPTATPIPSATAIRAPTVVRFVIEPSTVAAGQPVNVTWELRGVTSATLSYEGLSEPIDPTQGTRSLVPPGSTTLVLQASGPGGSVRQERSLTVEPPTPIPPPTELPTPVPTDTPDPLRAESADPAPTTTPASQPAPDDTDSTGALSNDALPNDALPNDALPNDALPNDALPNDALPNDALPNDALPDNALPDNALPDGASGSLPPTEPLDVDGENIGNPPLAAEPTALPTAEPTSAVALPALGSAAGDGVTLLDADPTGTALPLRWVLVFVAGASAVIGAALLSFGVLLILIRRGEEQSLD